MRVQRERFLVPILLIFVVPLLSACESRVDMYFYEQEHWNARIFFTVDQNALDVVLSIGQVILREVDIPAIPDAVFRSENWIQALLTWQNAQWQAEGVKSHWSHRKDGYLIDLSGEGYSQFCNAFYHKFEIAHTEDNNAFSLTGNLDFLNALNGFLPYDNTVIIHVGEVLSCHGCQIENGQEAIWRNPSAIDIIFFPKKKSVWNSSWCLGIVFMVVAVVIFIFLSKTYKRKVCPVCGHTFRKNVQICPHCGAYVYQDFDAFSEKGVGHENY